MKKNLSNHNLEKGQVLPLVVLMMFVIIGMVALILDGSAVMSNRRTAQAAADAGAMAGAQRACSGHGAADAKAVAEKYALDYNNATSALATVNGQVVTVEATVDNPSFFARIFGEETLTATADATASCYGPRGNSVIPLAFYCRAGTLVGPGSDNYDCVMLTLDWDEELKPLMNGSTVAIDGVNYSMSGTNIVDSTDKPLMDYIYIIMEDGSKVCVSDGGDFPCDLDGDGKDEFQFGGNRGWLYLTDPAQNLKEYIQLGVDSGINISGHQWLSGKPGETTSLYKDMINESFVGKVVLVPVYNYLCEGDPRDVDSPCMAAAHQPPWDPEPADGDNMDAISSKSDNYHIVTFAPFYVSCIAFTDKADVCPGYYRATIDYPALGLDTNSISIIEGYFVSGYPTSADSTDGCDINTGNCTISLSD